jgi:hypothetical protein
MTALLSIEPLREQDELARYIDAHWQRGHVLARDPAMLRFTYATPWVDRELFPTGLSVLGAYSDEDLLMGFLGAIVAPYPHPSSYWLALWHVVPELKGTGVGGKLLQSMDDLALVDGGWMGGFGIGPEALPVYLKRGYNVRAARRWLWLGDTEEQGNEEHRTRSCLHSTEQLQDDAWIDYRFRSHPTFTYDLRDGSVFRTENNRWGRVTHAVSLAARSRSAVQRVWNEESKIARDAGSRYLLDAWAFESPGAGWSLAPADLPSVFHPPEARGNLIYAMGKPYLPTEIQKSDGDQDRPN